MEGNAIKEEETRGKRSLRWRWPLAALVVVFLAVAATSRIGSFFSDPKFFSFSQQESGENKVLQKQEKLEQQVSTISYCLPGIPYYCWRGSPPSSYSVKFESCKTMMELVNDGYYESRPFTAGGFTWTFIIYPRGIDKSVHRSLTYVSLYAKIHNSSLPADPQDVVYAEIKFFVYSPYVKQYFYYQEYDPVMFHSFKPEWGVQKFQLTSLFETPGAGYVSVGGQCEFGIDVFVAPPFNQWEHFSYDQNIINPICNWNLTDFSTRDHESYPSDTICCGGRKWVLKVYPNGNGLGTGNSLSIYLLSAESNGRDYVRVKLRVLNQNSCDSVEKQVEGWSSVAENGWGCEKCISLSDLKDGTKGYLVNDLLRVEVEIMAFSKIDSI